jgi:predicted ATPase
MGKRIAMAICALAVAGALVPASASANITVKRAADLTFKYAKKQCNRTRACKAYGVNNCLRHNGGVSCYAWNYDIYQGKKYACKRLVHWKNQSNARVGKWKCLRGWNYGPQ